MLRLHPFFDSGAGGDGGGDTTETPEQVAEKEGVELQDLLSKESSLDDNQKARLAALKEKYETVEVDSEGNPITPEKKQQIEELKKKVDAILAKPEDQRTADEVKFLEENTEEDKPAGSAQDLFKQVAELTGFEVEIDYEKEGIKDPLSAEGIALREQVIREKVVLDYQEVLKTKAPRAYQFLAHVINGGKEEDFFKPENEDYKSITLRKDDLATAETLYRKALSLKGIAPDEVDALVLKAKDSKELYDKASKELEVLQRKQAERETQSANEAKAKQEAQDKANEQLLGLIEEKLQKGFGGVSVPSVERTKFMENFTGSIMYNNGKFFVIKEVSPNNLETVMKTEYFGYKGGKLEELAERKAKDINARRLKDSIKIKVVPKGGTEKKRYVPLSEI